MNSTIKLRCPECDQTAFVEPDAPLTEARCRFCYALLSPSKVDEPFAMAPLRCEQCHAPVPILNDHPVQTCAQCHAACTLPPDHLALFLTRRRTSAQQKEASALYERIGNAPHPIIGFAASFAEKVVLPLASVLLSITQVFVRIAVALMELHLIFATLALAPLALLYWAISIALHSSGRWLGFDALTVFGPIGAWALTGAILLTAIALPIAIARHFEELREIRGRLRALLAATPPTSEGGASTCRCCGAALAVAPGDFGARCLYCNADNLVRISATEAARYAGNARSVSSSVEDAAEEESVARAKADAAVRLVVTTALVVEVLFLIGGWVEATFAQASGLH